ncbi:paramyosin-like [Papaver somniferum]|uniref:paramyosin-like n=1 Tax=Papaver somniferum TaxID=3469 RepID=UPI000E6F9D2A|nr:paramyosin-like [Papaver somniferum]
MDIVVNISDHDDDEDIFSADDEEETMKGEVAVVAGSGSSSGDRVPVIAPAVDEVPEAETGMLTALPQYNDISVTFDTLRPESRIILLDEIASLDLDAASEYLLMNRKWDIEKGHVENLLQRVTNKDGKIDRLQEEIDRLKGDLERCQRFEYVPDEMDQLRAHLGKFQKIAADKTLLADNLESQTHSLRLQIRDLRVDRQRLLKEKAEVEQANQKLCDKVGRFEKVTQDLYWTQAQLSTLQISHDRQKSDWSDHKKYCPSNEFNEQHYNKLTMKLSKAEDELTKSVESLQMVLPALSAEQGRVRSLELEIEELKKNKTGLKVRATAAEQEVVKLKEHIVTAEAASQQLCRQISEERVAHQTEIAERVTAGVNQYIEKKRQDIAMKKGGSKATPPQE